VSGKSKKGRVKKKVKKGVCMSEERKCVKKGRERKEECVCVVGCEKG